MGIFDWLSSGPSEKGIEKQVKHAKEIYAQPDARKMAMEKLLEWRTEESIEGVLSRFTVVVQSPHWDEEEKTWLVKELIALGDIAKAPLKKFILKADDITYVIEALKALLPTSEYTEALLDALHARRPDDYRSFRAKIELIAALTLLDDEQAAQAIVPYLNDHNDDVKCASVDALKAKQYKPAFDVFKSMLSDDLNSARVLRHVASAVQSLGVDIDDSHKLAESVLEDFKIENGKLHLRHQ